MNFTRNDKNYNIKIIQWCDEWLRGSHANTNLNNKIPFTFLFFMSYWIVFTKNLD